MSKTRINYLYRDADNYKKYNSVVVPGVFTEDEKQRIIDSLDGVYFVPDAVGFPEDKLALKYIREANPNCEISQFRMKDIVSDGGGLHCITWNILE